MPAAALLTDFSPLIPVLGLAGAIVGAWLAQRYRSAVCRPAVCQLPSLSGPLTYGSASERREWFRRKGGRVKVRVADATANDDLGTGWIIDRSTGGLCLRVDARLEEGAVVSVRPVHAPGRMPWVQVEVKSCRECSGGWVVGCQFVRRPSWDVMLHFG
jgi:PilZ domain